MITRVSHTPTPGHDTTRRNNRDQRITTCRYLRRGTNGQCTAEALDPGADILICARHTLAVITLIRDSAPALIGAHQ